MSIKLDTIALNKTLETIKNLNEIILDFTAFTVNINKSYIANNQYKITKKYNLHETIKNKIYGLEKLEIKQIYFENEECEKKDMYVPIMSIMFNSKLLHNDYLSGLNKNNIDIALQNLIKPLENIIKLSKRIILNNFQVGYVDFTENIKIDTQYTICDYLKAIEYGTEIKRGLKQINTRFVNEGTLYFDLSYKNNYKFYDKQKDINDTIKSRKNTVNKQFYTEYNNLLAKSNNILRCEIRFNNKNHRLYKLLNIPKTKKITLNKLLNSNLKNNVPYSELKRFSSIDTYHKIIYELKNNDIKNYFDLLIGYAINNIYFNSKKESPITELKKDISESSINKSKQTKYNNIKKAILLHRKYLTTQKNKIDYLSIYNDLLNRLKQG